MNFATPTKQPATGMGAWQLCQLNPNSPKTFPLQQINKYFFGTLQIS